MTDVDETGLVAFAQELVRIPSVHDPDRGLDEQPAADLVATQMRAFGWEPVIDVVAPGRPNVVAVLEGGGGDGPTLMFEGHTDVVTEGDGWTVDPFGGEVRNGRLWGRGAADMKGGLAAMLFATHALASPRALPRSCRAGRPRRRGRHDARRQGPRRPRPHRGRRRRHLLRTRGRRDLPRRQGRPSATSRPAGQDGPRSDAVRGTQPEPRRRRGDRRAGRARARPPGVATTRIRTSGRCGSRRPCWPPGAPVR